ncbi:MAG: adenylosuccinate lyase [Candidatus Altiarchaeales archaeon]|nr:adenylosuccinate lyase [Candidatus Altiarchaeales archaeon]
MAVHPVEFRYGRDVVRGIFSEENRLQRMLDVEAALARAHSVVGNFSKKDVDVISRKANTKFVKISRVNEIEKVTNHDVMAVVKALAEKCGSSGGFVHLGATSNDITDTALSLQLRDYVKFLSEDLLKLKKAVLMQAGRHKKTVCIGRTHGQHAVPTTYGLKFAIWASELQRHLDRLEECKQRILVGKMSGAVGTQAALGRHAVRIQELVMKELGLKPALVSNQVLQRDRIAEFMLLMALIAESLNKFGTEIRNLQRTEIGEVSEGFGKKQVGSSTMPHKRNPIYAERICGISRVIKADAMAALENVPLWHERDLTNSSCERIIIPEACILTDYILNLTVDLISNLVFNHRKIKENLNLSQGRIMAESMMIKLVEKGLDRQKAHELTRECAMESYSKNRPFRDILEKNREITKMLSKKELENALKSESYIGTAVEQVEKALKQLR